MTKKPVWNKENEEFLTKLLSAGATASQASNEINNRFDMYFSRNSIISKARRLKIEFVVKTGKNYSPGSIRYKQTYNIKKVDTAKFIKAWNDKIKLHELQEIFGIKCKSILEKARKLKLDRRSIDSRKFIKDVNHTNANIIKKPPSIMPHREAFPNPKALGLGLMSLGPDQCRFIVGSGRPADFLYCAAPVEPDSPVPYCPTCRTIVYVKPVTSIDKIRKLFR